MGDRRLHILLLSGWFPFPADNGSRIRVANILRQLSQNHRVTLLSFSHTPCYSAEAEPLCDAVHVVPWKDFQPTSRRARCGFLDLRPRSIVDTYSRPMAQSIRAALSRTPYDVVIASQVTMAAYAPCFGNVPALFDEVELAVLRDQYLTAPSAARRLRHGLTWFKHRNYVRRLLRRFRACTVVSAVERQLVLDAIPKPPRIEVVPNAVSLSSYPMAARSPLPRRLIFLGSMTYSANYDAMEWYLREVHPRVRADIGDVELLVTGDRGTAPLPEVPNVRYTGMVPDILPLLRSAAVSIVPLRIGGGTRLKILEAMAAGTPVVSTSKGCEGLEVEPGVHLLTGDDASDFASQVVRCVNEPATGDQLSQQARRLVMERYDWAVVGPRFEDLVVEVAAGARRID